MREHNPSCITMAKVLFEDENPQVTAKLIVDFEDEDEFVEVPIGASQPKFTSDDEGDTWKGINAVKRVTWYMDSYRPGKPCRVVALRIDFIDCNDYALKSQSAVICADDVCSFATSYSISCDREEEQQIC